MITQQLITNKIFFKGFVSAVRIVERKIVQAERNDLSHHDGWSTVDVAAEMVKPQQLNIKTKKIS